MLDLDTLIIMIYVLVEEWYREEIEPYKPKRGRPRLFTDPEMLTIAILSEWRSGVMWQSERGCLRYFHHYYQEWFPHLIQRSTFNLRKRRLMGVFIRLQQYLTQILCVANVNYEVVDSLPIPAGTTGQYKREKHHWLCESQIGHGSHGWIWGDRLLMSVTERGIITGWLLGSANLNDRWLMELFLSTREGCPQLVQPPRPTRHGRKADTPPPIGFFGILQGVGQAKSSVYLADGNFNGQRWINHWDTNYQAQVIAPPRYNEAHSWSGNWQRWLASHRQIIETVFANLCEIFDIKRLNAHSRWGQYTRIALKTVNHNLAIYFNRLLDRPLLAFGTLLVG